MLALAALVLQLLAAAADADAAVRPNIIFIVADDLGWNDLSFHGSDQIQTPNIDALAYNGIILNSHYVMPVCTPSRSALMTGLYPIHNGMQGMPIRAAEPRGMPLGKILPQYLKDLGYATRMIGKWHLGFYQEEYTPTFRGFDSHLGYWNGFVSYYDFILQDNRPNNVDLNGFDMRRNLTPAYDLVGHYATDVFTDEAVDIIRTHNKKVPLFLYMSHLAVHAANRGKLVEAPPEVTVKFKHIADPNRRTYAGMVYKLDESVGKLVAALEEANMLHNSIIVFSADNGAPTIGTYPNWGSNYPLRGVKETLWEGGVRAASFVWSPLIGGGPRVSDELMHICDWLPTLYVAAGGYVNNLPKMDGVNQWYSLSRNGPSERSEVLLNIDEVLQTAAIRMDSDKYHWKLVVGTVNNGTYDGYLGEGTNKFPERNPLYDVSAITKSKAYLSLEKLAQKRLIPYPTARTTMVDLRKKATIRCDYKVFNNKRCNPAEGPNQICLFDLKKDPCELNNLAPFFPNVAAYLFKALVQHRESLVPQPELQDQPNLADPVNFNGTWSSWIDENGRPYVSLSNSRKPLFAYDPYNALASETVESFAGS